MKKTIAMLLALVMVFALCACGSKQDTAAPAEGSAEAAAPADDFHIVLKLSHVFAPTEQLTVEMEQVAQRIKDRTNGAVEIETYGSGQLAVYKDNLQQVVDGANWIACEDPSYLADYNINFEALIAPMLSPTSASPIWSRPCARTLRTTTASTSSRSTSTSVSAACRPTRRSRLPTI